MKKYILKIGVISIISMLFMGKNIMANNKYDEINIDKYKINNTYIDNINEHIINKKNFIDKNFKITYKSINLNHEEYVKSQEGKLHIIQKNGKFINASINDVKLFSTPSSKLTESDIYQYLKLNKFRNVNIKKLNEYLNSISIQTNKKNIFYNQGNNFISAAKKYNIDPLYLVSHTMLETGNGQSKLAQGTEIILDNEGNAIYYEQLVDNKIKKFVKIKDKNTPENVNTITVYNFFGIGAIDGYALEGGVTTAYENGWTNIEKTIDGSAKWISEKYINSEKYNHQYNLYSMKWDYINKWHQYATDVEWPTKIAKLINNISYMYMNDILDIEIPLYKDFNGWIKEFDGKYTYIKQGQVHKGWLELDSLYYLNDDGKMITGWYNINNNWYHFNESGRLSRNTTIGNWIIDENGVATLISGEWKLENGYWYYINHDGSKKLGWLRLNESWYFLEDDGKMAVGWRKLGGSWYFFEENGIASTGWEKINNEWYYFYENGNMAQNTKIGNWIIDENGVATEIIIGWKLENGYWYYIDNNGNKKIGWLRLNDSWYFLEDDGKMAVGWRKLGGSWYFFEENGIASTGWEKINNEWYYFYENGNMAQNTKIGNWIIDENGIAKLIN